VARTQMAVVVSSKEWCDVASTTTDVIDAELSKLNNC